MCVSAVLRLVILTKIPQPVILAGRRGSSYGYVVTRSVTQPRRKPRYFGGGAAGCVRLRRTHILTGFARIIPDTRPSGSLRSRKIAPGDFFRFGRSVRLSHPAPPPLNTIGPPSLAIIPAFGGNDETGAARMTLCVFPPFYDSSFLQKHPTPSSSPAGGDPAMDMSSRVA